VEYIVSSADKDLGYKLTAKRLAWSQGYLPLLNVPVQIPATIAKRSKADLTDADVLGFRFSADGPVDRFLADCRTVTGRTSDRNKAATDRIFWVKGLSAYLNAKNVYLFKTNIAENARWLASQLGIVPLDDFEQRTLIGKLGLDSLKGPYFDLGNRETLFKLQTSFERGTRYRDISSFLVYTVWSLPPAVRVLSLLDLLTPHSVNKTFNPADHQHQALVLLGGLQLGISIGLTIAALGVADLEFLERRLRETLHDGPATFQQKLKYMKAFSEYKGLHLDNEEASLDLHSFPQLLEVVNRLILRRNHLNDAVRLLDIATHYHAVKQPFPHAPRWILDPITQKLGADILSLFIKSNGLAPEFLGLFNFPASPPQPNPQQSIPDEANGVGNGSEKERANSSPAADGKLESAAASSEPSTPSPTQSRNPAPSS
jgi:hypothetical protein